jgi:predicted TIM-barrel enzyme
MSVISPLVQRLKDKAANGEAVIAAGAGIGLSAKCAAAAGVDLIVVYNSGRYRMAGRGSTAGYLPYGDANQIVLDMAGEVIPMAAGVPVIAGVCGTDPFRMMPVYLDELRRVGYAGVQNFPTVGLIDGLFRQSLEETGMGYELEVRMVAEAHRLGLLTAPYVFNADEARAMADAGADLIVAHMGVTVKGMIGAQTGMSLEQAAERVQEIQEAAAAVAPDALVLCHGGPIAEPSDAEFVMRRTRGVVGFFGASSMERLPTEVAMTQRIREFTSLRTRPVAVPQA